MSLSGVEVSFGSAVALPIVDLHLGRGEILGLVGPSGSGKTTLLDCVLGLVEPTSGSVEVLGESYSELSTARKARLRRRGIGVISQNPQLLPEISVAENVAIGLLFDGSRRARALKLASVALEQVGLSGTEKLHPENLSGGEAQRVALARALVSQDVQLLVADEPTAALDAANVRRMAELMIGTARARGISVMVATHDAVVAQRCDRVHELREHRAHVPA